MNQILATSEATSKKKKSGPADIKTVIRVFAIVLIVFGVFMIGTGSYAIYKDNENKNSAPTKPTITETQKDEKTVLISVAHDKEIDRIEYRWGEGEIQTVTGNGRRNIEIEVEIPGGTNTLNVRAIDIQGQEISTDIEYTAEDIIKLENVGKKMKITAESETEIAYMTYRWDDEEEQRIDINSTTVEQEVDIPMGEHKLIVILVDVNNETITKEQVVKGVVKPVIEIEADEERENYLVTITDETGLDEIEVTLRGETKTVTVEDNATEVKYRFPLIENSDNLLEITAHNLEGISDTKGVKASK